MKLWREFGLDPNTGNPPMAMDYRHVEMLRETVLDAMPSLAVEIGSHKGHSTVAFLDAMNDLPDMMLHIFEPKPEPDLIRIIRASPHRDRIMLRKMAAWWSDIRPDFVFIDGDHGVPAIADMGWCLALDVPVIAMHDTHTVSRLPSCAGSAAVARLLSAIPDRLWTCDHEDRPHENTWRGFGVSRQIDL